MRAFLQNRREKNHGLASALRVGLMAVSLGLAAPAVLAAGGGGGGAGAGGGASGGSGVQTKPHHGVNQTDLTTCDPGQVWDAKKRKCLERHSGVLPDSDLTEYAFALAKADRYREAIDVLDLLDNPNTPRALN